jgi:hypothetical protein
VKLLAAATLAAICLAVPAFGRSTVECSSPGEWPHTNDAAWLARALTRAGLGPLGCTGSAFVADIGGNASIYVWTTRGSRASEPLSARTRVAGVVVRHGGVRGVWRARGRNVWVQTASNEPLPAVHRWAHIVRATLVTRG